MGPKHIGYSFLTDFSYTAKMAFPANNRIAEVRKQKKLSQQQLADLVGAHFVTISNLERGKLQLTHEWLERIADALKVDSAELVGQEPKPRIYVEGWLEGGELLAFEGDTAVAVDVELGFVEVIAASWFAIADDSLYPAFTKGDLIRMVTIDDEDPKEVEGCFGRLVLFQPADVPSEVILGYLTPGSTKGRVTLQPIGRPPLIDRPIKSIHLIDRCYYKPKLPRPLKQAMDKQSGGEGTNQKMT